MSTALQWFTSSYSTEEGGACLEAAAERASAHIRDPKTPRGAYLTVTPAVWAAFLALPQWPRA
ncbi:DNA-binding protein [Streptomyces yokosukanensis]|uniref:DNA-binding protein n=1 Tax=Streptomyces yokosukanensis TaxID=67386 RepID=A0A101NUL7_9ACTN|nr:DUF397 domain-containing protein [Streptomyces yokosukanensis]KUM99492.1 DNA-binding protein [Streptomyces yokosukanensis]